MTHADATRTCRRPLLLPPYPHPPPPADLVVESLLYDTAIFLFNLFIVFQDRNVGDMVVDILALEFFTMIDDEFKNAVLNFDSSFLDDMVIEAIVDGCYVGSQSSLENGRGGGAVVDAKGNESEGACAAVVTKVVILPLETVLHAIRTVCRIVGPVFSCIMIVYGPYCLGMPEG